MIAEGCDRLPSLCIERINEIHHADDNATVFIVRAGPISQAAVRLRAHDARIELPLERAGRSIQRKDFLRRRNPVEYSIDHDGAGLQAAGFLGVEGPSWL